MKKLLIGMTLLASTLSYASMPTNLIGAYELIGEGDPNLEYCPQEVEVVIEDGKLSISNFNGIEFDLSKNGERKEITKLDFESGNWDVSQSSSPDHVEKIISGELKSNTGIFNWFNNISQTEYIELDEQNPNEMTFGVTMSSKMTNRGDFYCKYSRM